MNEHIVIIGGGFGGLEAAFTLKELVPPRCTITLIDRNAHHSFIPSIHEIVSGKTGAESIRIPFAAVLGPAGIDFVQDEVLSLDRAQRQVGLRRGAVTYDYLVLCAGAESNFFGIPGAEQFSYRFRAAGDAERIRTEAMRQLDDPFTPVRFVLAGGGTEGVEAAGELLDLIKKEGRDDDLRSGKVSIDLIEGRDRLLTGFPGGAQDRAEEYLRGRGISLVTGHPIIEVRKDRVLLASGEGRDATILVWTGGIQPPRLVRELSLQKDGNGWLKVTEHLRSIDDERIFGIGDAVGIYDRSGALQLQRLAHHAEDQARIVALNIARQIAGREPVAYRPKSKPQLVSMGADMGILTTGERVLSGSWVVAIKKAVERKHLMGCLSRPVASAVLSGIPGAGFIRRLRSSLPWSG
jgi:NADH:quinone reductase (non-electrogenic)